MKTKKYTITGVGAGLLMHADTLVDVTHPIAKALREISKKSAKSKTDADHEEMKRLDFIGSLYHDDEIGPFIPAVNVEAMLRDAAKGQRLGKEFTRSVMVNEDKLRLEYKGPRDKKGLWEKGFHYTKTVKVSTSRVLRTRAWFEHWSLSFTVTFDEDHVNPDMMDWAVGTAGSRIGLSDWRPRFGRFEVTA